MSKDLLLRHKCPHYVIEEWLQIRNDRLTLRPVRYPSNASIKMLWNRQEVPQEGLWAPIEISSTTQGPFDITSLNDTFAYSLDGQATVTVNLPRGRNVKVADIYRPLKDSGLPVTIQDGKLIIRHNGKQDATLFMMGGTGHEIIGFSPLRRYHARNIIPGWDLVSDTNSIDPLARYIQFKDVLRSEDDIFELSYYTIRGVCRRCMGTGIENDLRHNIQGDVVLVGDQNLMLQEVNKIILTLKGSNVYHRWYGTSISTLVGSKLLGSSYTETQLVKEITDALNKYQQIKEQQSKYQPVTRAESLRRIVSIDVEQDNLELTAFNVSIVLESQAGELETFYTTLSINDINANGFSLVR